MLLSLLILLPLLGTLIIFIFFPRLSKYIKNCVSILCHSSVKPHTFISKPLKSGISSNMFGMISAYALGQLFLSFGVAFLFENVYSVDVLEINRNLISILEHWISWLIHNYSALSLPERFQAFYYTEYLIQQLDIRWLALNSYVGNLETLGQDQGEYYDELNAQAEDLRELINDLTELYRNMELDLEIPGIPATDFE